jgi:hypothetical protein
LNPLLESHEVQSQVYSAFYLFQFKAILPKHNVDNNLIIMSFIYQIIFSGIIHIKLVLSSGYFGVEGDCARVCQTSSSLSQNPSIKRRTEYFDERSEVKRIQRKLNLLF